MRNRIIAAVVSAVVLVSMAGCSNATSNVAATVNGHVITEATVAKTAAAVSDVLGLDPSNDAVGFVLENEIRGRVMTDILAQMDQTVTDDIRAKWASDETTWSQIMGAQAAIVPSLWNDPRTRSNISGLIDFYMVLTFVKSGKIDQNKFAALFYDAVITVNPRYGAWDSNKMTVTYRIDGLSSTPLASPSSFPAPSPS